MRALLRRHSRPEPAELELAAGRPSPDTCCVSYIDRYPAVPMIRPATGSDVAAITSIYNHYILHTVVTFEEEPISAMAMAGRMDVTASARLPWLVAEHKGRVIGYAYARKWSGRCSYRFSVESTVYLDPSETGQGFGTRLYEALLNNLRDQSMHVVIGGIALPNPASVALHERLGFQKVAHFREVGFKFKRWIDVGYWQTGLGQTGSPGG